MNWPHHPAYTLLIGMAQSLRLRGKALALLMAFPRGWRSQISYQISL